MTDVDRLYEAFTAARRAGEDPDPRVYLSQADGVDRAELGALIEGYLERAPRRAFNAERFAGSSAESAVDAVVGGWPVVLPRLRDEARLPRDELVRRLAAALGVSGREEKVHRYYHEMEQGRLEASGVSQRVLEALGSILGRSADVLRRTGEGLAGGGSLDAQSAPAFARLASPAPAASAAAGGGAPKAEDDGWDEVDELFRGGA